MNCTVFVFSLSAKIKSRHVYIFVDNMYCDAFELHVFVFAFVLHSKIKSGRAGMSNERLFVRDFGLACSAVFDLGQIFKSQLRNNIKY